METLHARSRPVSLSACTEDRRSSALVARVFEGGGGGGGVVYASPGIHRFLTYRNARATLT